MTPVSHSRGIMYSAPPKNTTRRDDDSVADESAESEEPSDAVETASVSEANSSVTDANWTGTVPADD